MPAGKSPTKSIKWPKVYEALKRQGMSKSQAAAISNSMWRKRKKEASEKYSHIDFTPPQGAREAAKRALEVRSGKPISQRGMTAVGIARARDLINAKSLSPETVRRMNNYFTRHEVDKKGSTWSEQGKGWQAWMGWGGDAGQAWSGKVVRQMNAADGKTATKEAEYSGAMIALFLKPADADKLALTEAQVPNSEILPAKDLHITLCYLGDTTKMDADAKMRAVVALLRVAVGCQAIKGVISGLGRFTTVEDGNANAIYASFDSPALPELRQAVSESLSLSGVAYPAEHGFTPHITLAYIPANASTPDVTLPALELEFSKVTLAWGDERLSFDLLPPVEMATEGMLTDGVTTKHLPGKHNQASHRSGRGGGGKASGATGGSGGTSDDNKPAAKPAENKPTADKPTRQIEQKPSKVSKIAEAIRERRQERQSNASTGAALGTVLAAGGLIAAAGLASALGGSGQDADEKTQELLDKGLIEETTDEDGNKAYKLTKEGEKRAKDVEGLQRTKAEADDNDKPSKSGGVGYGARAGQVIRGNLARGNDGQFTSAGAASSASSDKPPAKRETLQQRMARIQEQEKLAKKKPKGGKGGKSQAAAAAEKKKREAEKLAKQQAREAEQAKKRAEQETEKKKRDAEREEARQKREAERAARAAAKPARAAKPEKSGGGKGDSDKDKGDKGKQSQQKRDNRRKVQAELDKDIDRELFDAVSDAADGEEITPEQWSKLEGMGYAHRGVNREYSLTPAARSLMRAANSGNTEQARTAIRRAKRRSTSGEQKEASSALLVSIKERLALKKKDTLTLKHMRGAHDQRSHGRSTGRRAAYRASYSEMRSLGYSPAEARQIAKADSKTFAENERASKRQAQSQHRDYSAENSLGEAHDTFNKAGEKWSQGLTNKEKESLSFYQGDGFKDLNRSLRGQIDYGEKFATRMNEHAQNLDSAIGKSTIPENAIAYRGVLGKEGGYKVGDVIEDNAYTSTSLSREIAQGFADNYGSRGVVARYKLNKGDNGAYMAPIASIGYQSREMEVLLPRNSRYKVTNVTKEMVDGFPVTFIDVEIDMSGRVATSRKKEARKQLEIISEDKYGIVTPDGVVSNNKFGAGDADYTLIRAKKTPQTKKKEQEESASHNTTVSIKSLYQERKSHSWLTACRHAYRSAYNAARISGASKEDARLIGKLASERVRQDRQLKRQLSRQGYR